ncbi:MAG: flagellar hook capping FlgD N-terminal domain-containing protein [candidate division Zixibacteria bacterium]|nr:flagellar hook capping FlgD N-terminal domain-containing protein [candidate division Zixibacteria bacterium]
MSTVSDVTNIPGGVQQSTNISKELGKNDFLQLMITKLQYQDPLNPMEDEDFIAQLAQFSSLEQMNNIAEGISTSNEWDYLQMQSINNTMAAGLIGKDVKASYSGVFVDSDNTPRISYTMDQSASNVSFVIRNANNEVVATVEAQDVQAGVGSIEWDGCDDRGNRVDDGFYSVEATAVDIAGNTFTPRLSLAGRVESIIYRDGSAFLTVCGCEIPLGDVTAIGEPGSFTGDDGQDNG